MPLNKQNAHCITWTSDAYIIRYRILPPPSDMDTNPQEFIDAIYRLALEKQEKRCTQNVQLISERIMALLDIQNVARSELEARYLSSKSFDPTRRTIPGTLLPHVAISSLITHPSLQTTLPSSSHPTLHDSTRQTACSSADRCAYRTHTTLFRRRVSERSPRTNLRL